MRREPDSYPACYRDVSYTTDGQPVFRLPPWLWIYFAVIALLVVTRSVTGPISTPLGAW